MANNVHKYGFRFYSSLVGSGRPAALEGLIASGYAPTADPGAVSVGVSIGDPVNLLSTGFYELSTDTTTDDRLFGVVVAIQNAKVDSNQKSRPASYLPSGVTYATEKNTTKIAVLPFGRDYWEIDVDDNVQTTLAAYRALVGENADFVYQPDATSNPDRPRANPFLDISTHAVTAGLHFRIVGVSKTALNQDFTGLNVKLLVQLNQGSEPMLGPTGLVGL